MSTDLQYAVREVNKLPVNWKWVKFGDICKVQGGFAFKSGEYQKEGIPLVRISNLVNGIVSFDENIVYLLKTKLSSHKEFILQRGDTLIAMSGATTGKMATFDLDVPALLNQRVGRFRILSEDLCNPRFISFLVAQITKKVLKEAYGAAQPNISPTQIEQMDVPLPPLSEQRRIVAEIEKQFTRLEAGVSALKRVQANLKRYHAAVLKAACEGSLIPSKLDSWKTTPLSELVDILDSQRVPVNSKERAKRPGLVPYYGATGQVDFIDTHIFDEELVLLGEDGAPFLDPLKQKAYLIRGKSWVNNHAHVLRAKPGLLNSMLLYQLNSIDYKRYVSGTTRMKLPQGPMKQIPLKIPSLDDQKKIVAEVERRLSVIEEMKAVVKLNLDRAARFRQAILKRAFEGNLA